MDRRAFFATLAAAVVAPEPPAAPDTVEYFDTQYKGGWYFSEHSNLEWSQPLTFETFRAALVQFERLRVFDVDV